MIDPYKEPSCPFDYESVYMHDEGYSLELTGSQLDVTVEEVQVVLGLMATYIFLPNPNGGPRNDRNKSISVRSLAAFAALMRSHLGCSLASIFRMSGLECSPRTFYGQVENFEKYLLSTKATGSVAII